MNKMVEELFIASLNKFPEQRTLYSDLEKHHFINDFLYFIYSELIKSKESLVVFNLRANNNISSEQFNYLVNEVIEYHTCTTASAGYAYNKIKNSFLKQKTITDTFNVINNKTLDLEEVEDGLSKISEYVKENKAIDREVFSLEEVEIKKEEASKVLFGYSQLDKIIRVEKNWLITILARPGIGKTTFATNIACQNAIVGNKVLIIELEMTVSAIKFKTRGYNQIILKNILVHENTFITLSDIHKLAIMHEPDLIIIDQLNKIKNKKEKEYDVITNSMRECKILAGILKIPIILLHQINRNAEDKRPQLWHAKGSGSVEEESDAVLILDYKAQNNYISNVYVDKNRSPYGIKGQIDLSFNNKNDRYSDINNELPEVFNV